MRFRPHPVIFWCLILFAVISWLQVWSGANGFTKVIRFGDEFQDRALPELRDVPHHVFQNSGYDGQFYAQMALHPLVSSDAIARAVDGPNYRFRRILPSWLAWVGGMGQPWWILQAFSVLPMLAWLVLAFLLVRFWLPLDSTQNLVRALGCLFGVGVIASIELATPDLIGTVLVLASVTAFVRQREKSSIACLAAALLCKETFLLAGILRLNGFGGGWKAWRQRLLFGLMATLPLALWMFYLWNLGYPPSGGSSRNFTMPGVGLWFEAKEAWGFLLEGKNYNFFALFGLGIQGLCLLFYRRPEQPLWRVGMVFLALAFFLGEAVWEADPGAAYRVLIPITLAFNLCLPRDRRESLSFLLLGNISILVGMKYVLGFWWE